MYFQNLWNERAGQPPSHDLISMLSHGESTREMPFMEFLGNILLLIVGGNDTTRNSISGGLYAFNQYPDQLARLRAKPDLLPGAISEIIRWQTPVAHMRRTALSDVEFGGKTIRKGDKVIMWYVSGNRDDTVIDRPNELIIDRERPRRHLSFGFGIHRCVGNRLAEMQLRVVWEEILRRFPVIEIVDEPVRLKSCFLRAYRGMSVRIPKRI
jgi:cytochrome P450